MSISFLYNCNFHLLICFLLGNEAVEEMLGDTFDKDYYLKPLNRTSVEKK